MATTKSSPGHSPLSIYNFEDPGDFREAALVRGISISTTFCHATAKTMAKYSLTFPKACEFLVEHGAIVGGMPIIDLSKAHLWLTAEELEREKRPAAPIETEALSLSPPPTPCRIGEKIKCHCFTLFIHRHNLRKKSGLDISECIHDEYYCYNDDLAVFCCMDLRDFARVTEVIEKYKLEREVDYYLWSDPPLGIKIKPIVLPWLRIITENGIGYATYTTGGYD